MVGVQVCLDRHLSAATRDPLAVAVSGGGDSIALMHLTADWAARHRRPLTVLSVDHGLNPDAAGWNHTVAEAAQRLGADWRGLIWTEAKPDTGLPAAARRARHALLAEATRAVGARVLLMAHTADDLAEADWMREAGTALGEMRGWSPSPAWPEGRGLMVLRPLLEVTRAALRAWLIETGIGWIEDPANTDPRFLRSRARAAAPPLRSRAPWSPPRLDLDTDPLTGLIAGPVETAWLAQALVCASGRPTLPRRADVERLARRLAAGTDKAVLAGAQIAVRDGRIHVWREGGRSPPPVEELRAGPVQIWDGRFALRAQAPGWQIGPAAGQIRRLSRADQAWLAKLPPAARRSHPVFQRAGQPRPVLAHPQIQTVCLVAGRLVLASDGVKTEADLWATPWREPDRHPI